MPVHPPISNTTSSSLVFSSLDALPTQLAILDEDGVILYTNRAWREFGTEHDYQGDSSSVNTNYFGVCNLNTDANTTTTNEGIHAVIDNDRDKFSFEYPYEAPRERLRFTMRATRFTDDGEAYVQIAYLDITDRKHAKLEAEKRAERLRNLARMLSHDFRDPLSVAVDYVESLLDEMAASDRLEHVASVLDRMDDIITGALMLTRHDMVEGLSTVSLETHVAAAWEHVEAGTATLVVADSVEFRTDSNLLRYVLENLSWNSAGHDTSGDDLAVMVGVLSGDAAETGFYVEDDGVGIPTKTCDVVFEAGYSTGEKGTGLGLSVVAQAIHTRDWDVAVTEAEGGGARSEITGVERPV